MYQEFYGLKENPFSLTPDPQYLYFTPRHQEALAQLFYGVTEQKGFMVLIGEVGMGKTLLLNKLLDMFSENDILSAYIFNPAMTVTDLFEYISADFGLDCNAGSKGQFLMHLNNLLIDRFRQNKSTVLIVDEAQNLSFDILEELRMLTNLETSKKKLLQIVLSGQPELAFKLDHPSVRQLKQRISLRCKLKPLTIEQTRDYIESRLRTGGLIGEVPFTAEAMNKVHELSGGIPRLINNLCDNSLLTGFAYERLTIDESIIGEVAEDLQIVAPTAGVVPSNLLPVPTQAGAHAYQTAISSGWPSRLMHFSEMVRRFTRSIFRNARLNLANNRK